MKLAEEDTSGIDTSPVEAAFLLLMQWLHRQPEFTPEMLEDAEVQQFIRAHADILDKAVDFAIEQRPLDELSVRRLKESNYVFSGYKTFHELNEAFPSLLDSDGNRKPFEQFLNDVQKVNQSYNRWYLQAEYNFAMASAGMAARWKDFERDGDDYLLQYRTVGDKRVRESHRLMHGITLPITSKFWDWYFPPNGWNCRCTVVQVRKGKYPESDEREAMNLGSQATAGKHQEMMRFNPGKQMACFPAYNPYTISRCQDCEYRPGKLKLVKVPDNELCAACKVIREMVALYQDIPTKAGKLRIHKGHGKRERKENIRIATYLAEKHGYEIDLMDNPNDKPSADSYNRTLGVEEENKTASTPTVNAIDRLIRDGRKQADDIVLWIDSDVSYEDLSAAIRSRVRRSDNIKAITIIWDGKDIRLSREEILADGFKIRPADLK